MAKNWSNLKLELANPPVTVPEAIERLLLVLSNEDKLAIAAMAEEDLYALRFTLGLAIRNAWLNQVDSYLRAACGTFHPDDASHVIIRELWRALQPIRSTMSTSKISFGADKRWRSLPKPHQQAILSSVWLGQCRGSTPILDYSTQMVGNSLMLTGKCQTCGKEVRRVVD